MISEEKYESLHEGINDPGIFKAVFMAGGPGSGKSLASRKLGFASMGLREVNSDMAFEKGLKQAGLSLKMPEDEEEKRDAIRVHAKSLTAKRQDMYVKGRLGLVIDSTARDVKKILRQKRLLEQLGYETAMVFVNTSLETALDRNRTRQRSIPDNIVKDNHKVVRANMGKLQNAFGRANFFIIDNDGDVKDLDKNTTKVFPRLKGWVKGFPSNKMAIAWKSALTMKPMKNTQLAAEYEHPADMEKRLEEDKKKKLRFDNPLKGFPYNEDRVSDALKDKQDREKEQLKKKHDTEKDRDRLRLTRLKNVQTGQQDEGKESTDKAKEKAKKEIDKLRKQMTKHSRVINSPTISITRISIAIDQLNKIKKQIEDIKKKAGLTGAFYEAVSPAQQAAIAIAKKKSGKYDKDGNKKENVSPEVMKTKEKIYKDLKKKKDYFEKEYGSKAKEVMHGTAMNQAKKIHKVAEGRFNSELQRQLQLEALNMSQRRAIGMRMKRLANRIKIAKKKAQKRMASNAKLLQRAQKQARLKLFKKQTGGKTPGQVPLGTRIAISKKLDKKKGKIAKMAKKMLPKIKKKEVERLAQFRQNKNKDSKNPKG